MAGPRGIARRSVLASLVGSAWAVGAGHLPAARGETARKLRAADLKTVLVGKIAEFVRWPPHAGLSDQNRAFELVLLGDSALAVAMERFYGDSKARIAGHRVFFRRTSDVADVGSPHLLFVGDSVDEGLGDLIARLGNAPVLTVADGAGFASRGVAVNFYQVDDQVRFEISRRALARAGLQASYRLLSRARLIDDQQARR